MTTDDINNRFRFHPADNPQRAAEHDEVRRSCRHLVDRLNGLLPEGREKSLAITKLEEVMFWANAAIARSGSDS